MTRAENYVKISLALTERRYRLSLAVDSGDNAWLIRFYYADGSYAGVVIILESGEIQAWPNCTSETYVLDVIKGLAA